MDKTSAEINAQFCELCGIKKYLGYLYNIRTKERRYYFNRSSLYRLPNGWTHEDTISSALPNGEPIYPDLINNPKNFSLLINIHWEMFGELGQVYTNSYNECFEATYLRTRVQAINVCKSFGGGEMLDLYMQNVRNTKFYYFMEELDALVSQSNS